MKPVPKKLEFVCNVPREVGESTAESVVEDFTTREPDRLFLLIDTDDCFRRVSKRSDVFVGPAYLYYAGDVVGLYKKVGSLK